MRASAIDQLWDRLPFGLPRDFDFTQVRSVKDVTKIMSTLPNRDRGNAARQLFRVREQIGNDLAFAGLMAAWGHDHVEVIEAFGSDEGFAKALRRVAPPHGGAAPVRAWRGIIMDKVEPQKGVLGLSWTTNRDIAAWFAMRFHRSGLQSFVFYCDFDPGQILTFYDERAEAEVIVDWWTDLNPAEVILDYDEAYCLEVGNTPTPSRDALASWRAATDRHAALIKAYNAKLFSQG